MNWKQISTFLRVSERTLYRKRIELGVEDGFTEISEEDLDKEVTDTLTLTPYSGESYVRGSLRGKGIRVQRAIIRDGWNRQSNEEEICHLQAYIQCGWCKSFVAHRFKPQTHFMAICDTWVH